MSANIMQLNVKNLAQEQYNYLKEHTINILNEIIEKLKEDKLQEIEDMLNFSPAGDEMGNDNCYIDFSYYEDEAMDLDEILRKMADLKNKEIESKRW